jgi:hypothetical protein
MTNNNTTMDTQDTGQTTTQHWAQKTQDKQHNTGHRRQDKQQHNTGHRRHRTNNNTTLGTEDTGQTTLH